MGSIWVALWATLLIGLIPIAAISGFHWNAGTKAVLVAAVISYPITFASVMGRKAWERNRLGHPHLVTQVHLGDDERVSIWLMLRPGAAPQGVNELGLSVRRRGKKGYDARLGGVWGTRTIDRVGQPPPHLLYPDQFPGAPAIESGTWQFIWSDVRGGKRQEFLFHEEEITLAPRPRAEPPSLEADSGSGGQKSRGQHEA